MEREELIERARVAFVEAWEGVNDNVPSAERAPGARSRAGIEAALAVFKAAHAPTDDEREALDQIIRDADGWWPEARDAILAAGFRRSEVPSRPLNAEREQAAARFVMKELHDLRDMTTGEAAHHAFVSGAEWERDNAPFSEPQGEPSDAQVEAALQALGHARSGVTTPLMRAALRAAGGVR